MEDKKIEYCDECSGRGWCIYSCCGDDITGNDCDLCPSCYEHCGDDEEECEECQGTGMGEEWSDFIVYNDNLKDATINTSSNENPVKNKDGFMRWHDQTLTIFSSEINDSQEEIIKNNELQESDKIVWVKDLPKDILAEYQEQIKESK